MKNQIRWARGIFSVGMGVFGMAIATAFTPTEAQAIPPGPNQCIMGGGPFATFKDCDLWPDGSFWHSEFGGFIGYGGREGRVCDGFPPPFTDNDPNTVCPGWPR